ncbi:MAG TPA: HNH endonuclease signature motif containing protein, partial [Candidatus Acidoferrales bacterium]|nr:HNH endonuclease signature motif containing protein [Candidatus Acidoferrales bacterium]
MAIILKRQIDDADKAAILKQHGRKCFATGHVIPEGEPIQFDHIRAYALGGASELDNIAPMCGQHNREKGALPLEDFRVKLRLQEFFRQGDRLTLRDLLANLERNHEIPRFAQAVNVDQNGDSVTLSGASSSSTHTLYTCPTTGWHYFYATLDVELLDSDDDRDNTIGLQPRYLIFDKVFELYRHFQQHPV